MRGYWTNQNPIALGVFTRADQENNAREIWGYFQAKGWSIEAVSAMLGNAEDESYINPAQWQMGGIIEDPNPSNVEGFGLVQWTPWQNFPTAPFGSWSAGPNWRTDYIKQLDRIQYELEYDIDHPNQGQWVAFYDSRYGYVSFDMFAHLSDPHVEINYFLRNMTTFFFSGYERGTWSDTRVTNTIYWYNYLTQYGPLPPSGRLPIWLLFKLKERYYK